MRNLEARPFLKWAGGKTQLLSQIKEHYPQKLVQGKIKKYAEPFVGGGAVFFELCKSFEFEQIILNDYNEEIVLVYKVIQNNVEDLIAHLQQIEAQYLKLSLENQKVMFYSIRDKFNEEKKTIDYKNFSYNWIGHAANLIFLNKTCFNGLYRLNKKGLYNVPFGKHKKPTICDSENLKNVGIALKGVTLLQGDFEQLTNYIDDSTFVYMDPPYRPLSNTASFNDYSDSPFNDDSQRRLAAWYKLLNNKQAALMLSNSDPTNTDSEDTFFEDLYKPFNINKVSASRAINSKGSGRGNISELLITNEQ